MATSLSSTAPRLMDSVPAQPSGYRICISLTGFDWWTRARGDLLPKRQDLPEGGRDSYYGRPDQVNTDYFNFKTRQWVFSSGKSQAPVVHCVPRLRMRYPFLIWSCGRCCECRGATEKTGMGWARCEHRRLFGNVLAIDGRRVTRVVCVCGQTYDATKFFREHLALRHDCTPNFAHHSPPLGIVTVGLFHQKEKSEPKCSYAHLLNLPCNHPDFDAVIDVFDLKVIAFWPNDGPPPQANPEYFPDDVDQLRPIRKTGRSRDSIQFSGKLPLTADSPPLNHQQIRSGPPVHGIVMNTVGNTNGNFLRSSGSPKTPDHWNGFPAIAGSSSVSMHVAAAAAIGASGGYERCRDGGPEGIPSQSSFCKTGPQTQQQRISSPEDAKPLFFEVNGLTDPVILQAMEVLNGLYDQMLHHVKGVEEVKGEIFTEHMKLRDMLHKNYSLDDRENALVEESLAAAIGRDGVSKTSRGGVNGSRGDSSSPANYSRVFVDEGNGTNAHHHFDGTFPSDRTGFGQMYEEMETPSMAGCNSAGVSQGSFLYDNTNRSDGRVGDADNTIPLSDSYSPMSPSQSCMRVEEDSVSNVVGRVNGSSGAFMKFPSSGSGGSEVTTPMRRAVVASEEDNQVSTGSVAHLLQQHGNSSNMDNRSRIDEESNHKGGSNKMQNLDIVAGTASPSPVNGFFDGKSPPALRDRSSFSSLGLSLGRMTPSFSMDPHQTEEECTAFQQHQEVWPPGWTPGVEEDKNPNNHLEDVILVKSPRPADNKGVKRERE